MHDSQKKTFWYMFDWAMNILVIVLKFIYLVIWMWVNLHLAWPWALFEWISKMICADSCTSISIYDTENSKIPCQFWGNYHFFWVLWDFLKSLGSHLKRIESSVGVQKKRYLTLILISRSLLFSIKRSGKANS